ncbi:MAG: ankyrin repeat domain-containing protein, partial [bacterium]
HLFERTINTKNFDISSPIKETVDWWIDSSQYNNLADLTREIDEYEEINNEKTLSPFTTAESNYRTIHHWINNNHLPTAKHILKLNKINYKDKWTEDNKELIVSKLLLARVIQYSVKELSKIKDINKINSRFNINDHHDKSIESLLNELKNNSYLNNIENTISNCKCKKKINNEVYELFIQLYENTLVKEDKGQDAEKKAKIAYQRLKNLYVSESLSLLEYRSYHINLCRARYYVLKGNNKNALKYYVKSFKDGKYAAGDLLKEIIREGITVAAFLDKKREFKRFYKWAVLYDLFEKPYKEVSNWIVDHQKKQFYSIFPPKYYYSANVKKEKRIKQIEEFIINQDEWENRPVDKRSPDRKTKFGPRRRTQLMIFSEIGQINKVKELIKIGADPNIQSDDGATALILSLQTGHTEIASILLDQDLYESINAKTKKYNVTALQAAIDLADVDIVEKIIKKYNLTVNMRCSVDGSLGLSPLYYTVNKTRCKVDYRNKEAFMEALKMDDIQKRTGNVLFDNEIEESHENIINNPEYKEFIYLYEEKMRENKPSWYRIIKLLLESGADPNEEHDNNFTPVIYCAELGDLVIFKMLIEYGGNINKLTTDGSSVLSQALAEKKHDFANYLFTNFKLDNLVNKSFGKYRCYPIHAALLSFFDISSKNDYDLAIGNLKELLKYEVDINVKDNRDITPLMLAYQTKKKDIIKKVAEAGGGHIRSSGIITLD